MVRAALFQPVLKLTDATHFKPICSPDGGHTKWTPCSPGDPDAVEKQLDEVEPEDVQMPPLGLKDFIWSLDSNKSTVSAADILKHDEWTKESGKSSTLCINPTDNIFRE